jgi:hypothetical protein
MGKIKAMKKYLGLLVGLLIFTVPAAAQSKEELQRHYLTYLESEGYIPFLDQDGDVNFKVRGGTYYISVDEEDPLFFRIVYPGFWEVESEETWIEAAEAIMRANRTTKLAKLYIEAWDEIYAEASILLNTPEDFKRHFKRMISTIQRARQQFVDALYE